MIDGRTFQELAADADVAVWLRIRAATAFVTEAQWPRADRAFDEVLATASAGAGGAVMALPGALAWVAWAVRGVVAAGRGRRAPPASDVERLSCAPAALPRLSRNRANVAAALAALDARRLAAVAGVFLCDGDPERIADALGVRRRVFRETLGHAVLELAAVPKDRRGDYVDFVDALIFCRRMRKRLRIHEGSGLDARAVAATEAIVPELEGLFEQSRRLLTFAALAANHQAPGE
jgi:hypothetical protein